MKRRLLNWVSWLTKEYKWDWGTFGLSYVIEYRTEGELKGTPQTYMTLFDLRCNMCYAWTLGCDYHWFCGLCSECDKVMEKEARNLEEV